MREVAVRIFDDLDYAHDKTKNEATLTVTIGYNGTWRELDLSGKNHETLQRTITEWMRAGHVPESEPKPRGGGPKPGRRTTAGKTIPRESLEWGQNIRAFAEANGFSYMTTTGKYYYSTRLRNAYAAHLESQKEGK